MINRLTRKLTSKRFLLTAGLILATTIASRAWAQDAKSVYDDKCASCHGAGGNGDGPAGAALSPPAAPFAKALPGKSDAWIAKATKEGGPAVGLSPTMPPFSDLTDDQVKGLVAYMKKLK
ncbi:MAG TPA: cytochrome c [Candidatus Binataceae bacterium]|nr:cytochrome c [Candidatus Binataceae bacterium]